MSQKSTYGLEYGLFFGVPNNKVELLRGRGRWCFPFASRESAEAHFDDWLRTMCRWKQTELPAVRQTPKSWQAQVAGIDMELFPGPISFTLPIDGHAFRTFMNTFNRRDFWPGQPQGLETGWDSVWNEGDVRMNLWGQFDRLCGQYGGEHGSRTDIALSDTASVAPDLCFFRGGRDDIMLADYFGAVPDLIAEVLSAPSRALDRGQRMDLYRRCGVAHVLLLEPANETVEIYSLDRTRYSHRGTEGAGSSFAIDLFPEVRIAVDDLFATQSKRRQGRVSAERDLEPIPEWLLPADFQVGLEYFFNLGHPERRWEFWGNKAHSVLAFGSPAEAHARLERFVTEACRWEGTALRPIRPLAADAEQAEIGRFQLTRQGRLVWLHLAVDGRLYKELLRIWSRRDTWNWGE